MNTTAKRLKKLEEEIRRRGREFWGEFSNAELEALTNNDPETWIKVEKLNGYEIANLLFAIMTPKEKAELRQIEKQLKNNINMKGLSNQLYEYPNND